MQVDRTLIDWMLPRVWAQGQWTRAAEATLNTPLLMVTLGQHDMALLIDVGHLALDRVLNTLFPDSCVEFQAGDTLAREAQLLLHELLPRCRAQQERLALEPEGGPRAFSGGVQEALSLSVSAPEGTVAKRTRRL